MRFKLLSNRNAALIILSVLLAICLAFGIYMLPKTALADEADAVTPSPANASKWDGDLEAAGWGNTVTTVIGSSWNITVTDDNIKDAEEYETDGALHYEVKDTTVSIYDAAGFAYFSNQVYIGSYNNFNGYTVNLECDIDLNNKVWIPIGFGHRKINGGKDTAFMGTFEGNNHTIYNFNGTSFLKAIAIKNDTFIVQVDTVELRLPTVLDSGNYELHYGLFDTIYSITNDDPVIIQNLTVDNFEFDFGDDAILTENVVIGDENCLIADSIGTFVGFSYNSYNLINCKTNGGFIKGAVQETQAKKVRKLEVAAGLVGRSYNTTPTIIKKATFEKCVNHVNVGSFDKVGNHQRAGILGFVSSVALYCDNCENYGNVTGGTLAGGFYSFAQGGNFQFYNCTNYGNVTTAWITLDEMIEIDGENAGLKGYITSDPYGCTAGGFAAYLGGNNVVTLENCENYGTISAAENMLNTHVGGFVANLSATNTVTIKNITNYGEIINRSNRLYKVDGKYQGQNDTGGGKVYTGGLFGGLTSANLTLQNAINLGKVSYVEKTEMGDPVYADGRIGYVGFSASTLNYVDFAVSVYAPVQLNSSVSVQTATTIHSRDTVSEISSSENFILENNETVLAGLAEGVTGNIKIVIPSSVTKIKDGAFLGMGDCSFRASVSQAIFNSKQEIFVVAVDFSQATELEEIGDLAFAGTNISELVLPESVTTIGVGAFAQTKLANVTIPESVESIGKAAFGNNSNLSTVYIKNANIEWGEDVFNHAYGQALDVIAASEDYNTLSAYIDTADLSYEITIQYVFEGNEIGKEVRLYNRGYNYIKQEDGSWASVNANEITVGSSTGFNITCIDEDGKYISVERATEVLAEHYADGKVIFNVSTMGGNTQFFIAGSALAYDEDKEYTLDMLNALLAPTSRPVDDTMVVSIIAFNGESVDDLDVIKNAGEYTIKITDKEGETVYTEDLIITVLEKTVDISNLVWKNATGAGDDGSSTDLLDGVLYVYDYADNSGVYPSTTALADTRIAELGLNANPTVIQVKYSILRARGTIVNGEAEYATLTVKLELDGNTAFDVVYSNNEGSEIDRYTSTAKLTAKPNYKLVYSGTPADATARGLSVKQNADGTFTVTKVWYIADMSNWFIDGNKDFTVSNKEYGAELSFGVPVLANMDGGSVTYGGASDPVNVELTYNGTTYRFKRNVWKDYLNSSMPVGDYTLVLSADDFTVTEKIDDKEVSFFYAGFTETFHFTVTKAQLKTNWLDAIDDLLKEQTFNREYTGDLLLYNNSVQSELEKLLQPAGGINVERKGEWADAKYDNTYYSNVLSVTFNPANVYNDTYYTASGLSALNIDLNPGEYVVYYKVSALNFADSNEAARTDYYFTVKYIKMVDLPEVSFKEYNGVLQTADAYGTNEYVVSANNGGINAGDYDVEYTLINSDYYMWKLDGATVDDENLSAVYTVKFEITTADNEWTIDRSIISWAYGEFDATKNILRAQTKYLDSGKNIYFYITSDAEGENKLVENFYAPDGIITDTDTIEAIKALSANVNYYLFACPEASEYGNYTSKVSQGYEFKVALAANDWKVPFDVISWSYKGYDKDTNLFLGSVEHGTVTFVVLDKDGNELTDKFTTVTDDVADVLSKLPAGTYTVTGTVNVGDNYQTVTGGHKTLNITQAENAWTETPSVVTWVKGEYNADENLITAISVFGNVDMVIYETTDEDNVIYEVVNGEVKINELESAAVGYYTLKATVTGTDDWTGLEKTFTFQIFAPEGLAWWAWLLIIVGILAVIALVFFILHEKGVLQMLTGRFVIAMRTKMSVDATIAAVRAHKRAEEAKISIAEAEERDRREALKSASPEEQAAILEQKAQEAQALVEKMQGKMAQVQDKAKEIKANKTETAEKAENEVSNKEDKGE